MTNWINMGFHFKIYKNALHYACEFGYIEIVQFLIHKVEEEISEKITLNPELENILKGTNIFNSTDKNKKTPLYLAAENDNAEIASLILSVKDQYQIDINARDFQGSTPLYSAVRHNCLEVTELLLMNDADPNITPYQSKRSIVSEAVINRNYDIFDILCNFPNTNLFIPDSNKWTPVHFASQLNEVNFLKFFYEKDPDSLFSETSIGQTPFLIAVYWNCYDVFSFYLDIGEKLNINHQDSFGNTAVHLATKRNNINFIRNLLDVQNINLKIKNKKGETPLHMAISLWLDKLTRELAHSGECDMNSINADGLTPLLLATKKGNLSVVSFLILHQSVDCTATTPSGNNALHLAAKLRSPLVLKCLYKSERFDLTIKNSKGKTPLDIAIRKRRHQNEQFIRRALYSNESDSSSDKEYKSFSSDPVSGESNESMSSYSTDSDDDFRRNELEALKIDAASKSQNDFDSDAQNSSHEEEEEYQADYSS